MLFTSDSLQIIEYLFIKSHENNDYKSILPELDRGLFEKLYDFLVSVEESKYDIGEIMKNITREVKIHNFSLNHYIAKDILIYIKTKIDTRYDISFRIDNKTINLCLRCHKSMSKNKFNKMLERIIYAIATVVNLSADPKTIDIVLYLTPFKKNIDEIRKREDFTVDEVNSGSTLCSPQPHVIVSREEEFYKVIIHELIHAMDYDVKSDVSEISEIIKGMTNIDLPFNHYEAYTEFWANILNSYFMAKIMTSPHAPDYTLDLFIELIHYERLWSLFQCSKVLYLTECQIEPHLKYKKLCKLNLNTNVYSYFILRSFMMFDINTFMADMLSNNKNCIDLDNNIQFYNEYILKLVKKMIYNKNYKLLLKKNINDLLNIKKKQLLELTLRMSACELNVN